MIKWGTIRKKANEHKHEKEKNIEIDTVVNYMHVFYKVSSCYATAKGLIVPQFDRNYFRDEFGSTDKIDKRLEELEEGQQKILRAIGGRPRPDEVQASHVPPTQSRRKDTANVGPNDKQALKNFIVNAEKKYFWFGTKSQFRKSKIILACIYLALIAIGILSTIISSVCFKTYSTFTFFENIVLIQAIILLVYTLRTKKLYGDCELATHTSDIFILDADNVWRDSNNEKKRYKWLRRISYVAVIGNVICIWTMGSGAIRIFATIFELAFLGLTVSTVFLRINHFCMYTDLFISSFDAVRKVTIVHDSRENRLYTLEDYSHRFPEFL